MSALLRTWATAFRNDGAETTLARHLEASPFFRPLETASLTASVAWRTLREAVRSPRAWMGDAVVEASVAMRRCSLPIAISALVYVLTFASIILAAIVYAIGASDRQPSGVYTGLLRELVTWITMMIVAGVAGSAIAGDLGSRKIREELDALDVLGVDKFRTLVVPRVMAITFVALVLPLLIHIVATVGNSLAVTITLGLPLQTQWSGIELAMNPYDLAAACMKHLIIGFFLGVVACQKGLSASGGAEGVGRAVNETVAISFFGIWLFNGLFNFAYLTVVPEAIGLKG
jgi:phospholipid/cholesterol/gamma-HCH transport system permease protein